ncbi:MAG: YceI family protein [Methylorubrum populi]
MKRTPALAALLLASLALTVPGAARAQEAAAALTKDPNQVKAGRYRLDPAHGKITWSLNHLGFSTYYGQFTEVSGDLVLDPKEPGKSSLSVRIGTGSADALNEKLNAHLKQPDFLDVRNFPEATFLSSSVEPTSPTTARVNGTLTLRGVSKPVSFDATFNQAGVNPVDKAYSVGFDGWTVIKRSEFGVNAFLPLLGDEVALRLEGEFKLQ